MAFHPLLLSQIQKCLFCGTLQKGVPFKDIHKVAYHSLGYACRLEISRMYSSKSLEDLAKRSQLLAPTRKNVDRLISLGYVAFEKVNKRQSSYKLEHSFNYSVLFSLFPSFSKGLARNGVVRFNGWVILGFPVEYVWWEIRTTFIPNTAVFRVWGGFTGARFIHDRKW